MAEAAQQPRISYAEYLEIEAVSEVRHEWFDGQMFAMAGGTLTHAMLCAAVVRELGTLALRCGCLVLSADGRVRVDATGLTAYPDASVVCGMMQVSPEDKQAVTNPVLLVEVLSPSTAKDDQGRKFENYRKLASLKDYVLVSQDRRHVEIYSRSAEGFWAFREADAGDSLPLTAMAGVLSVDALYAGIPLDG